MKDDKIILSTSEEAAKFVTGLSGWVDKNGFFFGNDERAARYSGCTHTPCEDCGEPCQRGWLCCDSCREKRAIQRYAKRAQTEWDGTTPVYSEAHDKYFFDSGELLDYVNDHHNPEMTKIDLRLVLCEPVGLRSVDEDYWSDDFPDVGEYGEGELPVDVQEALDHLNEVLGKQAPVSWVPGKLAVKM